MSASNPSLSRLIENRADLDDPFAMQLALSRVHARLVPMRRAQGSYVPESAAQDWFTLPADRGLASYGLGRALRMLLDVLRGLTALHDTFTAAGKPFAHGEVSLAQFRVDLAGVCRLVPLTSRHSANADTEPAQEALGHLAPERLLGDGVDARADVFSAGVLLWEALAGRRLFEEGSADAIFDRLLGVKLLMPQLPPELAWAIPLKSVAARALAIDPQQRFHDCAELATAIAIVARERVATHQEIASFFGAPLRSVERRARDSARPSAEGSGAAHAPALLVPSSGPRSRRGDSVVVSSGTHPVQSVGSMSAASSAPPSSRSTGMSTLAPLGRSSRPPPPSLPSSSLPASSRPGPNAILAQSPLSSLPELHAPVVEPEPAPLSMRVPPSYVAELTPTSGPAPRSSRLPSALPERLAQRATAHTLSTQLDAEVQAESAAFRGSRSRALWTVLVILSITGALAVALLTYEGSEPRPAPTPTAPRPLEQAAPSDESRRPLFSPAAQGAGGGAAASGSFRSAAPSHAVRPASQAKTARPDGKGYGI